MPDTPPTPPPRYFPAQHHDGSTDLKPTVDLGNNDEYPQLGTKDMAIPKPLVAPPPPQLDLSEVIPDQLPEFRQYTEALAEELQVSPTAVVPLCLGIISLCSSCSYRVDLGRNWTEPSPLWIAVLLNSGERKSATLSKLMKPVSEWQKQNEENLRKPLARYREGRFQLEQQIKHLRLKLKAIPEANETHADHHKWMDQKDRLLDQLEAMEDLCLPSLVTSDCTPEAMRNLLLNNGGKVAVASAEMDASTILGSRYGNGTGPNYDILLKGHAGDDVTFHRSDRQGTITDPAISLVLCIQPNAISDAITEKSMVEKGLPQRFAFFHPTSMIGSRKLSPPSVPDHLSKWWHKTVTGLLNQDWPNKVVTIGDRPTRSAAGAKVIPLSESAYEVLIELRGELEKRLSLTHPSSPLRGFISKLAGTIGRIALNLELISNPSPRHISRQTMAAACRWVGPIIEHFEHTTDSAKGVGLYRSAEHFVDRLKALDPIGSMSERNLFKATNQAHGMDTMDKFRPVLDLVTSLGWIKLHEPETKPRGRPSVIYELNPHIWGL